MFNKIQIVLAFGVICSISSGVYSIETEALETKSVWANESPLPYKVQEIYPTVFKNHIVVAGGLSPDVDDNPIGVSDRFVVFDMGTKNWKEGAKLPEPRHHPMLVVVNDTLYSFGGFTVKDGGAWHNSKDVLKLVANENSTEANILETGKWVKISEMPAPLAETLSAVNNGQVHLVSGRTPKVSNKNNQWNDQTDQNSHFVYDPKSNSWTQGKPLPTARNSACSVTLDGQMHTIGGRTVVGGNLDTHEVFDFATGEWLTKAPLPAAQGGLACAVANEKIYVFGGEYFDNGGGVYKEVWEYTPSTDKWTQSSSMPDPRHGLGALSIDSSIYVIAGASQAGGNLTSNRVSVYTPE
jgi:N-acetylneuraminic acid mutarotase